MKNETLIYESKTSFLKYFIPVLLFLATIICFLTCYFNGLNFIIVTSVLGLFTLTTSFKDFLVIKVYDDKFEFNYSNIFGNFFDIKNTYYFDEITLYNCTIDEWTADFDESVIIIIVELLIPGRQGLKLFKTPIALIEITRKNKLGEIKNIKLETEIDKSQKKALDLISQMIYKQQKI